MEGNDDAILVKVGLFSGMPNPEMKLTEESASRYAELVRSALSSEPANPPPLPKLGEFFGFLVLAGERSKQLEIPREASIFKGVLTDMTQSELQHWPDVAGVERFLIRLAYEEGFGELLQKVDVPKPE